MHGCYWHGCPMHWKVPKTNAAFWEAKVARNARRHALVVRRLREAGWSVVTVWEHSVKARLAAEVSRIGHVLARRGHVCPV